MTESNIPIIDFSGYATDRTVLSRDICETLRTAGFLYLKNHGVDGNVVEGAFAKSRQFFGLPLEDKMAFARPESSIDICTGYVRIGQEKLNPSTTLEVRESFDLLPGSVPEMAKAPGFTEALLALEKQCRALAFQILHCIGIGLNLPDENFFVKCHPGLANGLSGCLFRTLMYPVHPIPAANHNADNGKVRCGTHSDYGSVTLLFQDDVGGLEVESSVRGVFVPVTPVAGAVLVNIGDLLEHWTSDELRATKHRVLLNDASRSLKARQSIAMFIHPDGDTVVESLRSGPAKYPPILAKDHLIERYKATYTP